jgi:hypothetical protein
MPWPEPGGLIELPDDEGDQYARLGYVEPAKPEDQPETPAKPDAEPENPTDPEAAPDAEPEPDGEPEIPAEPKAKGK